MKKAPRVRREGRHRLCVAVDRLGRSLIEVPNTVTLLRDCGIPVRSIAHAAVSTDLVGVGSGNGCPSRKQKQSASAEVRRTESWKAVHTAGMSLSLTADGACRGGTEPRERWTNPLAADCLP
jgi:hypothetical protein